MTIEWDRSRLRRGVVTAAHGRFATPPPLSPCPLYRLPARAPHPSGGEGVNTPKHAATLTLGRPGVLHGSYSLLIQDEEGQVVDPHSISAG